MREAELPDGTILEFPDGTTDEIIDSVVKRELISREPVPTSETGKGMGQGWFGAKAAVAKLGATIANRLGYEESEKGFLEAYNDYSQRADARAPRVSRLEDIGDINDALDFISQAAGQAIPYGLGGMAAAVGAGGAATALGVAAPVAGAIGLGAGALSMLPVNIGSNIEAQEKAGDGSVHLGAAAGTGVLQSIAESALGPSGRFLRGMIMPTVKKAVEEEVVKAVKKSAAKEVLKKYGKEAFWSATEQAGEEAFQNVLQQVQASETPLSQEALMETINNAAAGAVGGLLFSPIGAIRMKGGKKLDDKTPPPVEETPAPPAPPASTEPGGPAVPPPAVAPEETPSEADPFDIPENLRRTQGALEGFYSPTSKALESIKLDKAPPQQWLGTLKNTPGAKGEEISTTGLDVWLQEQKGPVSKKDIQDYLRENQVDLSEKQLGVPGQLSLQETQELDSLHDKTGKDGPGLTTKEKYRHHFLLNKEATVPSKYEQYSTPGGSNYREVLLTLPPKTQEEKLATALGGGRNRDDSSVLYRGPHWQGTPNVLAHARVKDFTDTTGAKVLHVDEIQSDWHQAGRKRGYKQEGKLPEGWRVEAQTLPPYGLVLFNDKNIRVERFANHRELNSYLENREGVPDAPFKSSWHELTFRRMLKEAIEKGYDKLTWSTGEQAAKNSHSNDRAKQGNEVFYDSILPKYASKFLKKYGAKVETSELVGAKNIDNKLAERTIRYGLLDGGVPDQNSRNLANSMATFLNNDQHLENTYRQIGDRWGSSAAEAARAGVMKAREAEGTSVKAHSIAITPEMRQAFSEGMPLYARSKEVFNTPKGKEFINGLKALAKKLLGKHADRIEFVHEITDPRAVKDLGTKDIRGVTMGLMAQVALSRSNPTYTTIHEADHLAERLGLWRPEDIKYFKTQHAAMAKLIDKAVAMGHPTLSTQDRAYMMRPDEIRAHALEAYTYIKDLGEKLPGGRLNNLLDKVYQFFKRVANYLQGRGYQTYQDLFEDFLAGKIGEREASNVVPFHKTTQGALLGEANRILKEAVLTKPYQASYRIPAWASLLNTVYFLAQRNPFVAKVYDAVAKMYHDISLYRAMQSERLKPFGNLSKVEKRRVYAAAIIARFNKTNLIPGQTIKNNTEFDMAALPVGEEMTLTATEWKGYQAILAWNKWQRDAIAAHYRQKMNKLGFNITGDLTPENMLAVVQDFSDKDPTKAKVEELAEHLKEMYDRFTNSTYVPMKRYGNTAVAVKDPNAPKGADPLHYETFDISGVKKRYNTAQMNKRIAELKAKFPGMKVTDPFVPTQEMLFKEFGPSFLRSLDAIKKRLDEDDQAALSEVQEKLGGKLEQAKLPPFLRQGKLIPGFSEDGERAIYDNVYQFAAWLSKDEHMGEVETGVEDARNPETHPSVHKFLDKYAKYVQNHVESYSWAKQAGFLWLLTDFSAAAMNLFQGLPTAAYLSQFSGKGLPRALARGYKEAFGAFSSGEALRSTKALLNPRGDELVADVLIDNSKLSHLFVEMPYLKESLETTLKPMQTAESVGLTGYGDSFLGRTSARLHPFKQWMGQAFGTTEVINRVAAYIATHEILKDPKSLAKAIEILSKNDKLFLHRLNSLKNPSEAAVKHLIAETVTEESQFVYGKHTRPEFMRGLGSVAFQFQNYPIRMLELMGRLLLAKGPEGRRAFALLMIGMAMTSGLWGLPFAENIKDIIQAFYEIANKHKINVDGEVRKALGQIADDGVVDVFLRGGLRMTPLNIGRRVGMGDVPLVSQILNILGYGSGSQVLQAPILAVAGGPFEAYKRAQGGSGVAGTVAPMLPKPLANMANALAWQEEGVRSGTDKMVVSPEEVSTFDVILKGATGIQPTDIAKKQEARRVILDSKDPYKDLRMSYYRRLGKLDAEVIRANREGDPERAAEAREQIKDLFQTIRDHNLDADKHEKIKISAATRRKNREEELRGIDALIKQLPKKSRAEAKRIKELY